MSADPALAGDSHLLTIAEVANALRVSKMTIYRMVHSGQLPAMRVGRSFRVSKAELNKSLDVDFEELRGA